MISSFHLFRVSGPQYSIIQTSQDKSSVEDRIMQLVHSAQVLTKLYIIEERAGVEVGVVQV